MKSGDGDTYRRTWGHDHTGRQEAVPVGCAQPAEQWDHARVMSSRTLLLLEAAWGLSQAGVDGSGARGWCAGPRLGGPIGEGLVAGVDEVGGGGGGRGLGGRGGGLVRRAGVWGGGAGRRLLFLGELVGLSVPLGPRELLVLLTSIPILPEG